MPINVTCPSCNASLRTPETAAGKQIKCPKCQTVIRVPEGPTAPDSPLTASPPPPMATAAPAAPKKAKNQPEDDERPRRRPIDDDDDVDDRPRRRWRQSFKAPSGGNSGLPIGLGIGAIALGLLAAVFSLVPCCGAFVAWPAGGIGLLLGLVGLTICLMAKEKNVGALIMTGLGSLINLGAIGLATVWWIWMAAGTAGSINNAGKMMEQASKQMEEAQREQLERMKKQNESQSPATPAEKQASQQNLQQIWRALGTYYDVNKSFPLPKGGPEPAKGRLSWRVAILPYIGQGELHLQFKLNEPWDSLANRKVLEQNPMPKIFASPRPRQGEERRTYFQTFTGDGTLFPGNTAVKLDDFKRQGKGGPSLWLVAEAANSVEWTRPDDITTPNVSLGGIYDGDFNVVCLDGSRHYVRKGSIGNQQVLQLINPNNTFGVAGWPPPP